MCSAHLYFRFHARWPNADIASSFNKSFMILKLSRIFSKPLAMMSWEKQLSRTGTTTSKCLHFSGKWGMLSQAIQNSNEELTERVRWIVYRRPLCNNPGYCSQSGRKHGISAFHFNGRFAESVSEICPQCAGGTAEATWHGNYSGHAGLYKPQPRLHEDHHILV